MSLCAQLARTHASTHARTPARSTGYITVAALAELDKRRTGAIMNVYFSAHRRNTILETAAQWAHGLCSAFNALQIDLVASCLAMDMRAHAGTLISHITDTHTL